MSLPSCDDVHCMSQLEKVLFLVMKFTTFKKKTILFIIMGNVDFIKDFMKVITILRIINLSMITLYFKTPMQ
jgi:hypothetical protein